MADVRPLTAKRSFTSALVHKPGPLCGKCPLRDQPYVGSRGKAAYKPYKTRHNNYMEVRNYG
jgi:hypothetical protein